jgi:tetratricopeptide (TPR) repeat protein
MKAFLAHSFSPQDERVVNKIRGFLESLDIICVSGERAQTTSIARKVKERIQESDLFVGIFTVEEVLRRGAGFLRKAEQVRTTSNWVIQESGFALGRGKEVLFVAEEGLDRFPQLQGDLEVVRFGRSSIEQDAFQRISQMISAIKAKVEAKSGVGTESPQIQTAKTTESNELPECHEPDSALGKLLLLEKDVKNARVLFEKEIKPRMKGSKEIEENAFALRLLHGFGDGEALQDLKSLVENFPDQTDVRIQLGLAYKQMMDYEHAEKEFSRTIKSINLSSREGRENFVLAQYHLAESIALQGGYDKASILLFSLLSDKALSDMSGIVLEDIAHLAKENKDSDGFVVSAEAALRQDASNKRLRFALAYHYAEAGYDKLSLLHYKKLTTIGGDEPSLNNIGVQYGRLGMVSKEVHAYSESAERKNSLAMANLAQQYLNAGFIQHAQKEIDRANRLAIEGIEIHGNIGLAKNRLDELASSDAKKEEAIIRQASQQSDFWIDYFRAICDGPSKRSLFVGEWNTPWGDIHVTVNESDGQLLGSGTVVSPYPLWYLFDKSVKESAPPMNERNIKISGSFVGSGLKYSIQVEEHMQTQYVAPQVTQIHEGTGYMVRDSLKRALKGLEKKKADDYEIVHWNGK